MDGAADDASDANDFLPHKNGRGVFGTMCVLDGTTAHQMDMHVLNL